MKDDTISRQAVLKLLSTMPPEEAMTKTLLIQSVKQMDDAQPTMETVTECNDLISRQAAIHAICRDGVRLERGGALMITISTAKQWAVDLLGDLPPAQPERKRGTWIDYVNSHCECSVCHTEWSYFQNEVECFEFCPNCGADMRGEQNDKGRR